MKRFLFFSQTFSDSILKSVKAWKVVSQKHVDLLTGLLIPDVDASCPHCVSIWEATGNIATSLFTRPMCFHHYSAYDFFGLTYYHKNKRMRTKLWQNEM